MQVPVSLLLLLAPSARPACCPALAVSSSAVGASHQRGQLGIYSADMLAMFDVDDVDVNILNMVFPPKIRITDLSTKVVTGRNCLFWWRQISTSRGCW